MTVEHEQFADPVASANTLASFRQIMSFEVNPLVWLPLGESFAAGRVTPWNLGKWVPAIWSADAVRDVRIRRAPR